MVLRNDTIISSNENINDTRQVKRPRRKVSSAGCDMSRAAAHRRYNEQQPHKQRLHSSIHPATDSIRSEIQGRCVWACEPRRRRNILLFCRLTRLCSSNRTPALPPPPPPSSRPAANSDAGAFVCQTTRRLRQSTNQPRQEFLAEPVQSPLFRPVQPEQTNSIPNAVFWLFDANSIGQCRSSSGPTRTTLSPSYLLQQPSHIPSPKWRQG